MAKCNDCWCEHYDKSRGNCDKCLKNEESKQRPDLDVILKRRAVKQAIVQAELNNRSKQNGQNR